MMLLTSRYNTKEKCSVINIEGGRNMLHRLSDSHMVAKFQNIFGVQTFEENSNVCYNMKVSYKVDGDEKFISVQRLWFYFFKFGAFMGTDMFYILFFSFWFWNIDGIVGRRLILIWCITMYIGQILKDILKHPRPESPPVIKLETVFLYEYGLPSTHALLAVILPVSILIFTWNRYEYSLTFGIACSLAWCLLVCSSRLYMGVHSLLDVIAGIGLAFPLLFIFIPLTDNMDHILLTSSLSPIIIIFLVLTFLFIYPKRDIWTITRWNNSEIIGTGIGVYLGYWLNYHLGFIKESNLPLPYKICCCSVDSIVLGIIRMILGITLSIIIRHFCKIVFRKLILNELPKHIDKKIMKDGFVLNSVYDKSEIIIRMLTCITLSFNIVFMLPCLFHYLGIQRQNWHTEI